MSTLSLTAVGGTRRKTSIALAANHLVTVVLAGQSLQRGFNDTTTKTENQVKGRFLLNVVITQGTTVFELFTGENETLLIRRDTFLILDLLLDIVNGVRAVFINDELPLLYSLFLCRRIYLSTSKVMVLPVRVFTKICMVRFYK